MIATVEDSDPKVGFNAAHHAAVTLGAGFTTVRDDTVRLGIGTDAKNARSRNLSFGNGSSQCENNLGITGGADVAHGSETGAPRDCRMVSRIETDLRIRILDRAQSIFSVELRRQVHVAIDEAGKDEFLAKIDKLTARRRIDKAVRHRFDPLAFDENALLRLGLSVGIGEQKASVYNLRLRGPC